MFPADFASVMLYGIEAGLVFMSCFVDGLIETFSTASLIGLSDALLAVAADSGKAFTTERKASWSCTSGGVNLHVVLLERVMGSKETCDG